MERPKRNEPLLLPPETVHAEATGDGSMTLRHPVLGDLYHSSRGAFGEAEHVYIRAGFDACSGPDVRVFEMGFGSGLNALLTLRRAGETGRRVEYHTVEFYPLAWETVERLGYVSPEDPFYEPFRNMHICPWKEETEIAPGFRIKKHDGELADTEPDAIFDVIYFDAFAAETQPDLWSETVFRKLFRHTAPGGVLVTYSAKGEVKRALRAAGYEVTRLPGALGKRHMVRAVRKTETSAR